MLQQQKVYRFTTTFTELMQASVNRQTKQSANNSANLIYPISKAP